MPAEATPSANQGCGQHAHAHPDQKYGRGMTQGCTYILRCADNTFYVGSTNDITTRLAAHQAGEGAEYTSRRLPVSIEWCGQFERIEDAFAFEKRLQGWSHAKRAAFIAGGFDAVKVRSKKHPSGR